MRKNIISIGIILILVVAGLLFWWYMTTTPSEVDIDAESQRIAPVDSNLFNNNTAKKVQERKTFGNIPIQISSDYQHTNLFK